MIYTRCLYDKKAVEFSLLIALLDRNREEALFWTYELYHSGFKEETISQKPFTPNNKVFFGDYLGISAVKGHVRPIWPRMDEGKITLWTAIIDPIKQ